MAATPPSARAESGSEANCFCACRSQSGEECGERQRAQGSQRPFWSGKYDVPLPGHNTAYHFTIFLIIGLPEFYAVAFRVGDVRKFAVFIYLSFSFLFYAILF